MTKPDWSEIWQAVDSVRGWLNEPEAKALYDLVRHMPADSNIAVELGAFMGRSTVALASGVRNAEKE